MAPELVVYTFSVLAFGAVVFGAVNLVSIKLFENQKEEAEKIFRHRVFSGDEETKRELGEFFRKAKRPIFLSALSFASAFVLFTTVAKRLWPSDSFLKTFISLLILLVIFGGPLIMLALAEIRIFSLKRDIMGRFDEN